MALSRTMTLHVLLEEYPFLESFLVGMDPVFARLGRPAARRTWSRMVTMADLATTMDRPWLGLLREIQMEVRRVSGVSPPIADDAAEPARRPALRDGLGAIMADLERGVPLADLSERIDELTHDLDAETVADLVRRFEGAARAADEELLAAAGRPPDWPVGRLSLYPSHPVRALQREIARVAELLGHVEEAVASLGDPPDARRWRTAQPVVAVLLRRLGELERQARRLRLAWYVTLSSRGGRGLAALLEEEGGEAVAAVDGLLRAERRDDAAFLSANTARAADLVRGVLATEERLLIPAMLRALDDDDWEAVAEQERVVGWALSPDQA